MVVRVIWDHLVSVRFRVPRLENIFPVKNTLLILVLCGLLLVSADEPMSLVFAIGIASILFRKPLLAWSATWQSSWWFVVLGIILGLYTEVCAILGNMHKPEAERILMSPHPAMDVVFGFFFYGLFILTWYAVLRRWNFSLWQVFWISGCFGILTEQFNPAVGGPTILMSAFLNPVLGIPMALLIACVYGIFPTLAYFLTQHTFGLRKGVSKTGWMLVSSLLFLQWAIFGNILLPILKRVFPDS